MKNCLSPSVVLTTLLAAGLLASALPAGATNYAGNGDTGFGGAVGNGVLSVTDDHTNITVNLQRGNSGTLGNASDVNLLVIYIDTGTGTATNTASFADNGGDEQRAISGFDGGGNRSLLVFTNGFKPSYAIAIKKDYMDVWSLANPTGFSYLDGAGQGGYGSANFSLTFNCAKLGLATNVPSTIKIFGTFISHTGYRSTETIAGNLVAGPLGAGWYPFTNTAYVTYTFAPAAVPTYPVKFSVDMTAAAAAGNFVPGTDSVYCGGSFQTNPFAFTDFPLVRSNSSSIYTNTYADANVTNTVETYKFMFASVAGATNSYDADPNRSFTLQSGGQVLPLIYFNNVPNSPSATTNYITFQIDMGPQIYLTHFNPGGGDLIEVSGGFQSPQFAAGIILTNNPTSATSNIYTATVADYNYPGTQYLPPQNGYKFVIVTSTSTNYESGANRSLDTVTNAGTLPLAYFNNVSTYAAIPITFSVDMTVPIAMGMITSGDTVGCSGTFMTNQWTVGNVNSFLLTNNPTAANSNVYSGTYIDRNAPGSVEHYKFVVNTNGGGTAYESPASTGGGDRIFLLGSSAATNPLVFWNDVNSSQVLLVPTTVTFTVDMGGAIDIFGFPFDAGNDLAVINGDFVTPAWNVYPNNTPPSFWTDAYFYDPIDNISDYGPNNPHGPSFVLQDSGDGQHFVGTFTIPAGHSHQVNYKYGIYHNSSAFMTNCDNEATSGNDHHRYVRATGTYAFPTDVFGAQRTSAAAATEALYGIAAGLATPGRLPLSWLGFPGVHLQTCTNLSNQVWQDLTNTNGTGTTNWPTTGNGERYFRLWPTPQ